jgi:HPt (histidine-containing phosphotransfer) domain-containing protein
MRALPHPNPLDPRSLSALRTTLGSEESFQGILRDFLSSSDQLSAQLEAGLAGGRADEVGRAAHTLKSMARLLGASRLGETCRQVETLAHNRPLAVPSDLVQATMDQLEAAQRAVGMLMP